MLTKQINNKGLQINTKVFKACFSLVLMAVVLSGMLVSPVFAQDVPPTDEHPEVEVQTELSEAIIPDEQLKHSPQKATLLSATLPGLGQIYNGKYWKVPIIYGLFAASGYAINFNNQNYQDFRQAYLATIDGNPNTNPDERFRLFRTDNLRLGMEFYRRNLEISILAAAAVYVLNILDATVDAHLLDFDVGEDLTLNVQPSIFQPPVDQMFAQRPVAGIKLSFRINMP